MKISTIVKLPQYSLILPVAQVTGKGQSAITGDKANTRAPIANPIWDLEDIADVANLERRFSQQFNRSVDHLLQQIRKHLATGDDITTFSNFISGGLEGTVYKLHCCGRDYAVKQGGINLQTVRATRLAEGIDNVSHAVAINLERDIGIWELMPGNALGMLTADEKVQIPDKDFIAMVVTTRTLNKNGLTVDTENGGNILYDKDNGITIIDYQTPDNWSVSLLGQASGLSPVSRLGQVMGLSKALTRGTSDQHNHDPRQLAYFRSIFQGGDSLRAAQSEKRAGEAKVLSRYLDILESYFPEILQEAKRYQLELNASDPNCRSIFCFIPQGSEYHKLKHRLASLALVGPGGY